ncbi:Glucosaminyl phosphatidylinositol (GlcN-PI) nositol acylation protein [Savitreella phatthalungensis]
MSQMQLKEQEALSKLLFYTNLTGSSVGEIARLTGIIVLAHAVYTALTRWRVFSVQEILPSAAAYVLVPLLAFTVYSGDAILWLAGLLVGWLTIGYLFRPRAALHPVAATQASIPNDRVPYVTAYRSIMMISTIICILAVDLPIFPRRYAKTESFGQSLMDLGVGSFVFSSGVVASPKAQRLVAARGALPMGVWTSAIRDQGTLLALGLVRSALVWGTGYHEHVSEYGVHWNFFVTLALLAPALPAAVAIKRATRLPFIFQAIAFASIYQLALTRYGLEHFIIDAPRPDGDLVRQNREGLCSFVGYLCIFLLGLDAGDIVLSTRWKRPVISLLTITTVCHWAAYSFARGPLHLQVSRRMANLPYIALSAAHNAGLLAALALVQKFVAGRSASGQGHSSAVVSPNKNTSRKTLTRTRKTPSDSGSGEPQIAVLLEKFNQSGLTIFLAANLATGGINLLMGDRMPTTPTYTGLGILIAYAAVITTLAWFI